MAHWALFATVLGAVVVAWGIFANLRWGWLLGLLIAGICFVLYLAQETVGLPGLPRMWCQKGSLFLSPKRR